MSDVKEEIDKVAVKKAAKATKFKSTFGVLVHPFTGTRFEAGGVVEHEPDSWVQCQVDALKLEEVK